MPTFKNCTDKIINYESGGKIYSFLPGRTFGLAEWIPYQELGLELIDENYPKVPSSILISGRFKFSKGLERKFSIPHCESYNLKISVKSGALKLYTSNSTLGVELSGDYVTTLQWSYTPFIRLKGLEAGTEASVHAEIERLMQ